MKNSLSLVSLFCAVGLLILSNDVFGQASVLNNGIYPKHETTDQRTIVVRFDQAVNGSTVVGDWTVQVAGTTVVTSSALVLGGTDVAITFDATALNGNPFLLPGQALTIQFTNASGLTKTVAGGANALPTGGFIPSNNKWVGDCGDFQFKQQGLIPAKSPKICSPVVEDFTQYQFYLTLRVRNSNDWNNGGAAIFHQINWGDGVTTNELSYISDAVGNASATFVDPTAFAGDPAVITTTRPVHNYPATLPGTGGDCSWNATATPVLNLATFTVCNGLSQQTVFATYDTDNKNTGLLNFPPVPATANRICLGTNANVQFSDNTNLNCRLAVEATVPNQRTRNIRFTYGSTNYGVPGNIPDVRITLPAILGGATVPITNNDATGSLIFPSGYKPTSVGAADANGVINLPANVTVSTALTYAAQIKTTLTDQQAVGQRFYIKMEYWDVCNPYSALVPASLLLAESIENYVEIVTKPQPLTATGQAICYTNPNSTAFNFTIGGTVAGASFNWYKNSTTGVVPIQTGASTSFPASSYTTVNGFPANFASNDVNGAYYSVWATQVVASTNSCESDPLEVVIIQQPQIDPANLPATPTGTSPVCNGNAVVYTEPTTPPNKPIAITHYANAATINLATENLWSHGFGAGTTLTPSVGNSTTVTFGIPTQPATSTTANVGAALQFASGVVSVTTNFPAPTTPAFFKYDIPIQACTTPATNKSVQVFGTSAAGAIAPAAQAVCVGTAAANIVSSATVPLPIRGSIIRWERQVNSAGGFVDAGIGTGSSVNVNGIIPVVGGLPTLYEFRAVYQNGPCSVANGPVATVTVNPRPTSGTLSGTATICAGGTTNLVVTVTGGTTALYTVVYHSVATGNVAVANYTSGNNIPVSPGANTTYDLVSVTDANGCTATAVGGTPTVTVQSPPAITAQPVSRVICEDATTTFAVTATGTTLTYQWQRDPNTGTYVDITDGVTDGAGVYTNAQTATLTINTSGTGVTLNNYKYKVVITGVCPPAVTSATPRTLTIQPKASITTQPTSGANICINGTKTFTVVAAGTATLTYQWQVDPDGAGPAPFADVPTAVGDPYTNETTASLTINTTGTGSTLNGARYQVIVNSTGCPAAVTSGTVTLTQQGPTTTITQGATGSVCAGNNFPLTGNETFLNGTAASSVWTGTFDETGPPVLIVLTNANLDALLTDGVGGSRRTALNPIFNSNVAPFVGKTGVFVLTLTTTDNNACTNTAAITITVSQVVAAIKYGATAGTITQTNLNAATCSSIPVFLNGNPSGGSGVFAGGVSQHTWTKVSGPGGAIGTLLDNPAIQSPIFTAASTGAGADVYVLRYFVQDNVGCNFITSAPTDITITVNPLPAAANQTPAAICSTIAGGNQAVVDLTALNTLINAGSGVSTTIAWFTTYNVGTKVFGGAIGAPTTATVTDATAVFARVTQNATGCVSPATVTYTVNPRPASPTGGVPTTFCSTTGPVAISVSNPGAGLTTDWYAAATGGAPLAGGIGTNSFVPPAAGNYFAETRNTVSSCVSTTRLSIKSTIDNAVAVATAGADQPSKTTCNLPITLAGNTIVGGVGAWTIPAKLLYYQNFSNFANGDTTSAAVNGFSRNVGRPCTTQFPCHTPGGSFQVGNVPANPRYEAINTNGALTGGVPNQGTVIWFSSVVDISGVTSVEANVDIINGGIAGPAVGDDFVQVNYSLNGAAEQPFTTLPTYINSFASNTSKVFGLTGSTLQIIVRIRTDGAADKVAIDNVLIKESTIGNLIFDNPNLAGAQPAGFPTPAAGTAALTTTYRWTASSLYGVCPNTFDEVDVTINAVPKILAGQTASACSGSAVNYEIKLDPTLNFPAGTTFSWPDPDGGGPATAKAGLAADPAGTFHITDVLTNTTGSPQPVIYTVTPTNSLGCAGTAVTVTVTVLPAPKINTGQVKTICSGQPVNYQILMTPVNAPAGTKFSWPDPDGAGPATAMASINADPAGTLHITDVLTNFTIAPITVTYTVTPTGPAPSNCVGAPQDVVITVNPLPTTNTIVGQGTVCAGPTVLLYQVAPHLGSSYAWTVPPPFVKFAGGTTSDFFVLVQFPAVGTGTIQMTETNSFNCTGTSNDLFVTVANAPGALSITGPDPVCKNESGVNYSVPIGVFNPSSTYNWSASGATITSASSGPGLQTITVDFGLSAAATISVNEVSVSGCSGAPFTKNIAVSNIPTMASANAESICSGATTTLVFNAAPASTFSWKVTSITGPITAATVPPLAVGKTGTGDLSATFFGAAALINNSAAVGSVAFDVTPSTSAAPFCQGPTQNVVITINPKPAIPAQAASVCSGATFTVSPTDGVPTAATIVPSGTMYTWTAPAITGGLTGGGAQAIPVASISQTLTNPTNAQQTAIYTVTPISGAAGACVGSTFLVTVTVNPKPVISAQVATVCSGATFTVTPADGVPTATTIVPAGTTYTWTAPLVTGGMTGGSAQATGQPNISQTLTNPTSIVQTAQYTVTPTSGAAGACAGSTFTVTITVNPKPSIPPQTPAVCSGAAFTVSPVDGLPTSATVVPAGTTYTWTAPAVTGGVTGGSAQLTGQPSISQTLTNPTNAVQTAIYTVTPTSGAAGTCVGSTFTITVSVNPVPAIANQTPAICSGTAFSVAPADGVPTAATIVPAGTTYTWTAPSVTGGVTGGSAQGAGQTTISQTLTNPTNAPQTAMYTVTPTSGAAGTCVGSTFTITVTVNPKPAIPSQTATVCSGAAFTINPANGVPTAATIVPAGTTYTWTAPAVTGGLTGGSAQPVGQPTISQTLNNPTNSSQFATYTVTPTSGGCTGTAFTAIVSVDPMPSIPAQVATICSGTAFTISPTNSVPTPATVVPGGTTYTWTAPSVSGGITGGSAQLTGQPNISQTLTNPTNAPQTAIYTVTPLSGGCTGATFTITVSVNPKPVIANQTPAICSGTAFTVSPTNGSPTAATIVPAGTTYTWPAPLVTGGVTGSSAQSNQASISQTLTNPTNVFQTVTYTVTPTSGDAGACVGSTFTITVTVNPKPFVPAQTPAICSGSAFTVTPADGVPTAATVVPAGTTYTWTAPAVSGGITGGSAQATGQTSISQVLTNPTNIVQSAVYTVTPTSGASGACVGSTFTITVTVNPMPVIAAQTATICSGAAFTVTPANSVPTVATIVPAGTTYTWTAPAVTGGLTGGSAQATGQTSISQTLTNPTNVFQTATYTVTPTSGAAGACVGSTFTVTVTVNPKPFIPTQTPAICSGAAFTVAPVDGLPTASTIVPAGTTYTWAAPVVTGGLLGGSAQAIGQPNVSQTLTNPTNLVQTATYTVTPTSGSSGLCVGPTFTITVTVNPKPAVSNQTPTICSGTAFTVAPVDGLPTAATIVPAGTTYTWTAPSLSGAITGGSAQATGQPSISQTLTNTTNAVLTATYTVTPTSGASGACVGSTFTITVTVNPKPVIPAQAATICSGNAFTINPADGVPTAATIVPAGTTYTWTAPSVSGGITGGSAQPTGQPNISQTLTNPTNVVQTATYTVTPTSGAAGACVGSTFTITVTVNPKPVIPAQTATICSGTAFTINPVDGIPSAATIVPAGTTYTWTAPSVSGGITGGSAQVTGQPTISQTLTNPTNVVQTATYTVTPTSGAAGTCVGSTFTITVTVNPTPVIPAQAAAICSGAPFTVSPTNSTPTVATIVPAGTTYTWPAPVATGGVTGSGPQTNQSPISQTLTNPTNTLQTVTYTVTPTSGAAGSCVGATFTLIVDVNPKPVIPAQSATICSGTAFNISPTNGSPTAATIVPGGTTYTWTVPIVTGGITGGSAQVTGQPSVSQTLTNPTNSVQTATYTVTPTSGAAGACVGSTFTVTVTVNPKPVIPTQLVTVCSGTTFTVAPVDGVPTVGTVVPPSTTYTWPAPSVTGGLTGGSAQAVGQLNVSQTLTNPTNIAQTATYTVTPTSGAAGTCVGATFTITVTVNPKPIAQALSSIQRCSGAAINFDLQDIINNVPPFAGGNSVASTFTYTVLADFPLDLTPPVFPGSFDRTVASAAIINQTFSNFSNHDVTLTYTVTPFSNIGNCPGTPFTFKVVYHPQPVGQNITDPGCSSTLNHNIQTTQITNGLASVFTYVVTSSDEINVPTPVGLDRTIASSAPITDTFTNSTSATVTITYTITPFNAANPTCAGATFTYKVDIGSKPVGTSNTKPVVCSDVAFTIDPQGNITNGVTSTFAWTAIYDPGLTAGGSPPPASGTGVISQTLTNITNAQKNATYTITPTAGPCAGAPFTIIKPVNPEPVMDPALATTTICSTNPTSTNKVNVVLNTNGVSITAASYNITLKSQDVGLTGTPTTGSALSATAIQNDTYNNVTSLPLRVVYTIVPVSTGGACLGDPFDITVTVNPEPVLSNLDNTVCSTDISNIIMSTNGTSVAANSYKLISVTVPGGLTPNAGNAAVGTVSGTSLIRNDKYTNSTTGALIAVYNIRGTSLAGCEGASKVINLTVNPAPVLDPTLNPTPVCSGLTSNVTLGVAAGSVAAATYNINTITFPGLTAGGSNTGIGAGKPANAIFNDVYVNTTNAPLTATYSIAPVSALGCVGPVGTLTLTINPSPAVDDNLNKTICSAGTSGISLATKSTSVAAVNYNIVSIVTQVGLTPGGANVAIPALSKPTNYLATDVFTNTTNGVLTVTYRVEAVSAAGCIGPQKDIVLTVEPAVIAAPLNHKATICSSSGSTNDPTDIELVSPTVPSAGTITFNYTAVSNIGSQITGFVPSLTNLAAGYHITDNLVNTSNSAVGAFVTYTITPVASGAKGGSGCIGTPINIVVNVEPKPKLVAAPTIKTVCEGVLTNVTLNSPTTPSAGSIEFLLVTVVPTGGVTGASVAGSVFANASALNDNLDNPTTTVQTVTYTLRPRVTGGAGCIGDDVTVTVNVNPRPVITATPQAPICSGDQIDITLTADVSTTVSIWTASAPATITGAGPGAGDRIFQVLFNNGNIVETVTYTVTPQASGCAGTPLIINVQVNPKAKVLGIPATPVVVCHGNSLNVPLSSNVAAGVTYDWTVDDPSGLGVPLTGSGNTIVQPMTNTLGYQASLTYTITPTGPGPGAGCVGDSKIMIVNVSPQITAGFLNSPSPDFICKGSTEYLIFQFGGQPLFSFTYDKGGPDIIVTNKGPIAVIQDVPLVTTTYTIKSVTDGLGCTTPFSVPLTVNVGDTDPTFSIISPTATCNPNRVSFQYNQVAGTTYTWRWGDSADSVYTATTTVPNMVLKHTYTNLSPTSTLNYPVSMQTELQAPYPGCFKTTPPKTVTIYPTILPNIISDKTDICSGESVLFMNQSVGATSQTWSYRIQGQVPETVMGSSVNISQVFTNPSASNPIIYEVIYRGTNGFCPAPDQIIPIQVYRSAVPGFNEGVVPPYVGGQSIVNFTNTSVPVDGTAFIYDWTFGSDAVPINFSGTTPPPIKYVRPGPKNVVLTVTNSLRPVCKYTFQKTINVDILPLVATFTVTPQEGCGPLMVTTTSNITGDVIEWKVVDQAGRVAATSNGANPAFILQLAGDYTIYLNTSYSLTGQVANAPPQKVTVYAKPFASFDARPDVVYVPDTEMSTFNFSTGANKYAWDFGDGGTSDLEEPTHIYKIEGIYNLQLFAQYDHGNNIVCADTLVRQVTAKQGGVTKVPNAFTPNPNGPSGGVPSNGSFNDVFLPIVKGADEYNLQIYDRWGNLIFESNSTQIGWDGYNKDGKIMPAGVYVYKLTIRLSDGQRSTQLGDVTMIR